MLAKGDAGGVFQMEGQGVRDMLRQMRPDRFEDLVAAVALYRPGPMDSIPEYCRRKHAGISEAPHPDLHDILAETYGIIVYQEQVMQIAQKLAGYSLGGADLLRRAMGKKIPAEMEAQREIFIEGAIYRGIDPKKAEGSVRPDGEVRRLWLQQMPRRAVCITGLPDGLAEGEPSRSVHRRLHESGARQHRPSRRVEAGGGTRRHPHPAARHQ